MLRQFTSPEAQVSFLVNGECSELCCSSLVPFYAVAEIPLVGTSMGMGIAAV
jgi:hypothetical protein